MKPRMVRTRNGLEMPVLGQGTWKMGDAPKRREQEVRALRTGFDLGLTLIDTAEMYGGGRSEELVGEAIAGRREELILVTKVLPQNASRAGVRKACEASLGRLRTDRIDLYLLHWPGRHPVCETVEAFERLRDEGKILHWGVSNFDVAGCEEVERCTKGKQAAANQIYYNLQRRGIERKLLPWCRARHVVVMAYTPFEQGRLRTKGVLDEVAARHGATVYQIALAWILRHEGVMTIPQSGSEQHVRENAAALAIELSTTDLRQLNQAFPAPSQDVPLETT
ncbi:MAG TPA: aldo/keto reductase [bacterium]|nr:aldo/keto reductase [bacterium]